ncbi:prolyl oligopeptidase family serine peptidase [Marinobacter profundi]|uniref:Peptidase S9 prolyl oligopeptidase catalytic domain-containing protein n=1 Tax=Marinobacter profundi TaxID=2666256 RepID=A0A2G1URL5_9GAMM|nr:prolyl oligopeptidase family serine peptidase [Marinobacter profundi]PHQ17095.1 hypothetical protein CLH61_00615 [Marinobacter profundi]
MTQLCRLGLAISFGILVGCGEGSDGTSLAGGPQTDASAVLPGVAEKRSMDCSKDSWVAGTVEWCQGRLTYYDYVYDDYGADSGLISPAPTVLNVLNRGGESGLPFAITPGLLSPTAGDDRYPPELLNTADLVKLHVEQVDGVVRIEAEVNTLFNPDDAILGVALDFDPEQSTGGGHWGRVNVSSEGWDQVYFQDRGAPETNTLLLEIPLPHSDVWRLQAVVAQADGTVMNVAFRGVNEEASADASPEQISPGAGNWWEDRQAEALGRGDISAFGIQIRNRDFLVGRTQTGELSAGFHQRVYTSDYPLGEGVAIPAIEGRDGGGIFCGQSFNYLGKYQPYGIYVPESAIEGNAKPGMMVVMHGCQANHSSQINQANMQQRFGDAFNRILVAPLGRGPFGFYTGPSERDVLDAMEDVQDTYAVDSTKVFASGYSMGGYGALHFATSYPDRFAGLVNWVGYTGDLLNTPELTPVVDDLLTTAKDELLSPVLGEILGSLADAEEGFENALDFVGNLRHVPGAHLYAGADELVHVNQALAIAQRLAAEESLEYHVYLHPVAEHLTFLLLDDWRKEAHLSANWVREENPVRVTYTFDPTFDYPEMDIKHDSAYWISELVARNRARAQVDLSASGCESIAEQSSAQVTGGFDPLPWSGLKGSITEIPGPATSALVGTLQNVARARIDVEATCLADMPIYYRVESDGAATIEFSDGRVLSVAEGIQEGVL